MEGTGNGLIDFALKAFQSVVTAFSGVITAVCNIDLDANSLNTVTLSIGSTLTALFFIMELFKEVALSRFETLEDAVKLAFKYVVAKIIIENSSGIVTIIYNTFFQSNKANLGSKINSTISSLTIANTEKLLQDGGFLGIGYLLDGILLVILMIMIAVFLTKLVIQLMGILFEIGVHMCVAPVALSTLCNDTARSAGISFIKSFTAVCMQVLVMQCCIDVYALLAEPMANLQSIFVDNMTSVVDTSTMILIDGFQFASPLLSLIILTQAITKSGEITKRMLGA